MSTIYECHNSIDGCSTERPKATSANWRAPVAEAGETAFVLPDDMKTVADKWKRGAKKASTSYELGSIALGKDGKLYTCDPYIADPNGTTVDYKPILITEEGLDDDGVV